MQKLNNFGHMLICDGFVVLDLGDSHIWLWIFGHNSAPRVSRMQSMKSWNVADWVIFDYDAE